MRSGGNVTMPPLQKHILIRLPDTNIQSRTPRLKNPPDSGYFFLSLHYHSLSSHKLFQQYSAFSIRNFI